jgi:arsenical pump membrane protein
MVVDALQQAWPPFALVAGLLLIGRAAEDDRLYEAAGARLAAAPIGSRSLLAALLALVAAVTAVLNLDTAVVFLTPVLVHAARSRRLDERPFLYGTVLMSNSASLLLPGSNLTNMIVAGGSAGYGSRMVLPWLASCVITALVVASAYRLESSAGTAPSSSPPVRVGAGIGAVCTAAALVVAVANPALPVLVLGLAVAALRGFGGVRRLDARPLALLFAVAVGLGVLGRAWDGPASLLAQLGAVPTAVAGAAAAVAVNNLPAATLLSAQPPAHPDALLLGLDLGPNLAFTGSLSAWLWLAAGRGAGSRPSLLTYTRLGAIVVPLTLAASLAALAVR